MKYGVDLARDLAMDDVNCVGLASASAPLSNRTTSAEEDQKEVRIFGCAKEFDAAEEYCQELGGHLTSLYSAQDFASLELAVVRAIISQFHVHAVRVRSLLLK